MKIGLNTSSRSVPVKALLSLSLTCMILFLLYNLALADKQKTRAHSTNLQSTAATELGARPSDEEVKLFKSSKVESNLQKYESLLRQAQTSNRMDPNQTRALVDQLNMAESQLVQSLNDSVAVQGMNKSEKKSCVDERVECKEKHGAFQGCGIQFMACLAAKVRGKATVGPKKIKSAN